LRFLGEGEAEVKGAGTGKSYLFSETAREMDVDPSDARGMLRGPEFVLA
jgi:predicted transcriptional regulator with HTH domain